MNGFGDFLYELRKEKGMTQAELAQLLGVTNKAVSKWETGEAMPETALLMPISRIFGVSVDELLDGKRSADGAEELNEDKVFTRGKDDPTDKTLAGKIKGAVCVAIVFSGFFAYFILGIAAGLWHPYWVIIPVCALSSGIVGIIFDLCNAVSREYKIFKGENPYTGAACGIIMLVCIITYLLLGAFLNLWHPAWIILVVGAFLCATIAMIIEIVNHKK